jgi:heme exporter protein D
MGGYGLYVWGSFAVTGICMLAEPLLLAHRHRNALEKVKLERTRLETAP